MVNLWFNCDECEATFPRSRSLRRHRSSVHSRIAYKCQLCDVSTTRRFSLMLHVRTVHLKIKAFKCQLCAFSTSRKFNLQKHAQSLHGQQQQLQHPWTELAETAGTAGFPLLPLPPELLAPGMLQPPPSSVASPEVLLVDLYSSENEEDLSQIPILPHAAKNSPPATGQTIPDKRYIRNEARVIIGRLDAKSFYSELPKVPLPKVPLPNVSLPRVPLPLRSLTNNGVQCPLPKPRTSVSVGANDTFSWQQPSSAPFGFEKQNSDIVAEARNSQDVMVLSFEGGSMRPAFQCGGDTPNNQTAPRANVSTHLFPNAKKWSCSHCEFRTSSKWSLSRHVKSFHSAKHLKCNLCDFQTARTDQLNLHIARGHRGLQQASSSNKSEHNLRKDTPCKDIESSQAGVITGSCDVEIAVDSTEGHFKSVHDSFSNYGHTFAVDSIGAEEEEERPTSSSITDQSTSSLVINLESPEELQEVSDGLDDGLDEQTDGNTANPIPGKELTRQSRSDDVRARISIKCCSLCDFKTAFSRRLRRHVNSVHRLAKEYKCNLCPYETSRRKRLEFHSKKRHRPVGQEREEPAGEEKRGVARCKRGRPRDLACEICSFTTARREILSLHMKYRLNHGVVSTSRGQ